MKKFIMPILLAFILFIVLLFSCTAFSKPRTGGFHSSHSFKSTTSKSKSGLFHSSKSYTNKSSKNNTGSSTKRVLPKVNSNSNVNKHTGTGFHLFSSGVNLHFISFIPIRIIILILIIYLIYRIFNKNKK